MKFPFSWLKAYLPTEHSAEQVADALNQIGIEVEHLERVDDDIHFGVSLTPNLAHCNSVRGIARELCAYFDQKIVTPTFKLQQGKSKSLISVKVEQSEHCPRYCCKILTNVTVKSSPDWLKKRIEACGMRSVNNVVDATNLVMLELGQPLHAFDLEKIEGGQVCVRPPRREEKITTLDGTEHYPIDEMLLICDAKKPIAIAGVMGSVQSEVSETTSSILLESAYFEPTQVRRTSKRTGIQSEASYRFERGVDPESVIEALDMGASLIAELSDATVDSGVVDVTDASFEPRKVSCRLTQVNRILGTKLAMNEVTEIFRRIQLRVLTSKQDTMTVSIPLYRHDINYEIDLIEEVARFYGYDNLKRRNRPLFRTSKLSDAPLFRFEKDVRKTLLRSGLTECLCCDLISPKQAEMMISKQLPASSLIHVLNPRSQDQSVLRPSLMPGLLAVAKHNYDHAMQTILAFEIGRIHYKSKDQSIEQSAASIIMTGDLNPKHWSGKSKEINFFSLKGVVENILDHLKIENVELQSSAYPSFHPHRQATLTVNGIDIGVIGQLHPSMIDFEAPIFFAELHLEDLAQLTRNETKMKPLSIYPSTSFDWTVKVVDELSAKQLLSLLDKQNEPLLKSVTVLDLYHGEKVGSGWKNITLRFIYRDQKKTISHQLAQAAHDKITSAILDELKEKAHR